jgi:hypothetical protein
MEVEEEKMELMLVLVLTLVLLAKEGGGVSHRTLNELAEHTDEGGGAIETRDIGEALASAV